MRLALIGNTTSTLTRNNSTSYHYVRVTIFNFHHDFHTICTEISFGPPIPTLRIQLRYARRTTYRFPNSPDKSTHGVACNSNKCAFFQVYPSRNRPRVGIPSLSVQKPSSSRYSKSTSPETVLESVFQVYQS